MQTVPREYRCVQSTASIVPTRSGRGGETPTGEVQFRRMQPPRGSVATRLHLRNECALIGNHARPPASSSLHCRSCRAHPCRWRARNTGTGMRARTALVGGDAAVAPRRRNGVAGGVLRPRDAVSRSRLAGRIGSCRKAGRRASGLALCAGPRWRAPGPRTLPLRRLRSGVLPGRTSSAATSNPGRFSLGACRTRSLGLLRSVQRPRRMRRRCWQ